MGIEIAMDSDDTLSKKLKAKLQISPDLAGEEPDDTDVDDHGADYLNDCGVEFIFEDDNEDDDNFSDFLVEDDDYNDYALLQAQFDEARLPAGVEVSLPSLINLSSSSSSKDYPSPSSKFDAGSSSLGVTDDLNDCGVEVIFEDDNEDDDNFSDFFGVVYEDNDNNDYALLQAQFDKAHLPTGVELSLLSLINLSSSSSSSKDNPYPSSEYDAGSSSLGVTSMEHSLEIVQFRRFDMVGSFSDHHYARESENSCSKEWAKRIHKEWASLSTNLPETISVRVAEDRMDLLRAALVGPAGTPYYGGLFFFDCYFPPEYPHKPPLVHYHSRGLRINPNLYKCGMVCLSLLGTWQGKSTENWIPGKSTMLEVLVSIQALILNERPFFNEPGYEKTYVEEVGKRRSNAYNENVFILSLKTMVYTLRNPPEHFKDLVTLHFRKLGREILAACRSYGNKSIVESVAKKFKIFDQTTDKCSEKFTMEVKSMLNMLEACF